MRSMIPFPALIARLALALVFLSGGMAMAGPAESPELAAKRQEMKSRKRRVIYNNDGNELFITKLSSPDAFLSRRIVPALNTQVDSIFFCTLVTTLYQHDTDVAERWDDLVDAIGSTAKYAINARDNMRMLRAAGKDCLELVVERCHEEDLEVFWTHRINDIHDCFTPWLLSQWKREHPEYLMGKPDDRKKYPHSDPRNRWTALDFQKQEVRDYLFRITEEICQRYDVDGIEIDYFRNPCFFRPTMTFKPVTRAQTDLLTGFQRRITEMAYREGTKRGRPILVAARVPMTRRTCRHVGIDIGAWLREGLVDVLVTGGGYVPFTMPTRELVTLGHEHGVQVYPTISASGMKGRTIAGWRGAASNAWQAGADGVYLFNTFPRQAGHPHFTQLGDPEALAKMDKMFAIDNKPVRSGGLTQGITQDQILPVELDSGGKRRQVNLPVGDDIAAAAASGRLEKAILRVQFDSRTPDDRIEMHLNGRTAEAEKEEGNWVTFHAEPGQYLHGDNTLSLRVSARGPASAKPIVVRSVELRVDYK